MSLKIITTTEEKYNNLSVKDEHAMYLLDNGMFFINGKMYGNDTKVVDSFPSSPIPNVVYINSSTLEKKIWINGAWNNIEQIRSITNLEIDAICV